MPETLAGKTALVTGAAQGIGLAIAQAFAQEGAKVLTLDQKTTADITIGIQADLAELEAIPSLVASLEPLPDILVNAAGICPTRPFFDVDLPTFQKTLAINLLAPFLLLQHLAKRWIESQTPAVALNIASNSAFLPKLEQLDYGTSKAALVSLTRSAALALGPYQIRVNAIAPGVIDTPLTRQIAEQRAAIRQTTAENTLHPVVQSLPLQRIGLPEEVAKTALFLVSPQSSFVTGQTYLVDGGQLMR